MNGTQEVGMCASVANHQPEGRDHGVVQRAHLLPSHCAPANKDLIVFFLLYYREVRSGGLYVSPSFSQRLGSWADHSTSSIVHLISEVGGKLNGTRFKAPSKE